MYELEIILTGLAKMFKEPVKFFREISRQNTNLLIPIVVLIIAGILMSVISLAQLPLKIEDWKKNGYAQYYNINSLIQAEKTKVFLYPLWIFFLWFFLTVSLTYMSSGLGGWGEFNGFFNCTSFLVYPYTLLLILRFVLLLSPKLMIVYYILLTILILWTFYLLFAMTTGAGELGFNNALTAFLIPIFFFTILWFSYGPIINMIIVKAKT